MLERGRADFNAIEENQVIDLWASITRILFHTHYDDPEESDTAASSGFTTSHTRKATKNSDWGKLRRDVDRVLLMPFTEYSLLFSITVSLCLLWMETDANASSDAIALPGRVITRFLAMVFLGEVIARLYVMRWQFFRDWTADLCVVVVDAGLVLLDFFAENNTPHLSYFRAFRLVRLVRLIRIINMFPELVFLIQGLKSSFAAIFWGMIMVFIILITWSMLAVQLLHPVNKRVTAKGTYEVDGCERCPRAYASVWNALVTLTQQLIASDDSVTVSVPIIEEAWWTYFLFLAAISSVCLAMLNLILAAIVDSGQQAREDAAAARSRAEREIKEREHIKYCDYLMKLCNAIDEDESGCLSRIELLEGFDRNSEFQRAMKGMDFARIDLEVFFDVLDANGADEIPYRDLVDLMFRSKQEQSGVNVTFIKYAVMDMWMQLKQKDNQMLEVLCWMKRYIFSADEGHDEPVNKEGPGKTRFVRGGSFVEKAGLDSMGTLTNGPRKDVKVVSGKNHNGTVGSAECKEGRKKSNESSPARSPRQQREAITNVKVVPQSGEQRGVSNQNGIGHGKTPKASDAGDEMVTLQKRLESMTELLNRLDQSMNELVGKCARELAESMQMVLTQTQGQETILGSIDRSLTLIVEPTQLYEAGQTNFL